MICILYSNSPNISHLQALLVNKNVTRRKPLESTEILLIFKGRHPARCIVIFTVFCLKTYPGNILEICESFSISFLDLHVGYLIEVWQSGNALLNKFPMNNSQKLLQKRCALRRCCHKINGSHPV